MTYQGRVSGGVVILDEGQQLPEGTLVTVVPRNGEADQLRSKDDPVYQIADLAVSTGIPDLALNIDSYLYGHPKRHDDFLLPTA